MQIKRYYLMFAFAALSVIALLYGVSPRWFATTFTGVSDLHRDFIHVLRAVMGLYLAFGLFWLYSVFDQRYTDAAVLTTMVLSAGLVSGRLLSFLLDGWPSPLLAFYAVLELALVPVAYWVYRHPE